MVSPTPPPKKSQWGLKWFYHMMIGFRCYVKKQKLDCIHAAGPVAEQLPFGIITGIYSHSLTNFCIEPKYQRTAAEKMKIF